MLHHAAQALRFINDALCLAALALGFVAAWLFYRSGERNNRDHEE